MAGDVRVGGRARPASRARWSRRTPTWRSPSAPPFVSRGGHQAGQRARRLRRRPGGPARARRRRLDRRVHRLPAPARRRGGGRARRRLRRAALALRNDSARDGDRAPQRALARAGGAAVRARPDRGRRLVHLAARRCCRPCSRLRGADASTASRWSSRSSRSGASASARAAWCATADERRAALVAVGAHARERARRWRCSASRPPGCRARRATARASCGWPRRAAPGAVEDLEAAARRAEP